MEASIGRGGCRGVRGLGCALLGLSGLAVIFVPVSPESEAVRLASLSLFLASLAAPFYLVSQVRGVAWMAVSAAGLLLAFAAPHLWPIIVGVGVLGALILALESPPAGLVGMGVTASLAVVAGPGEYKWLVLAAYVLAASSASVILTRKIHAGLSALLAPLIVLYAGEPEAVALSLLPVLLFLAITGVVERSLCPFKSDSRIVLAGSALALAGVIGASPLSDGSDMIAARGIWAAGITLLLVGLLVPGPSGARLPRLQQRGV